MKICYISYENHIHDKRMLKWFRDNTDHELHLITTKDISIDGVSVHKIRFRIRFAPLNYILSAAEAVWIIWRIKPDILHLHTLYYPAALGIFAMHKCMIITPWNGDVLWSHPVGAIHKRLVRTGLRRARLIVANSDNMLEACNEIFGVPRERLMRIQWEGVDRARFAGPHDPASLRKKLGIKPEETVILSPRSIASIYNIDTIIRAASIIFRRRQNIKFVLIWNYCDQSILSRLRSLTSELNVADRVVFAGNVAHEDIPKYYAMSKAVVSCSDHDSTPVTLQESMVAGAVPVFVGIKPVREWIMDGENGFFSDAHNPLVTAIAIEKALNSDINKIREYNNEIIKVADYDLNMRKMEKEYERHAKG